MYRRGLSVVLAALFFGAVVTPALADNRVARLASLGQHRDIVAERITSALRSCAPFWPIVLKKSAKWRSRTDIGTRVVDRA